MATLLLSLLIGLSTPGLASGQSDSVRVTYVGNEGFLIESGGKKVLIDALYRSGVSGYVVHTPATRKQLERALPPFDNVDLVLATHYHADHFDPGAVGVHLLSNRAAQFLSTNQAAKQMAGYGAYRNIQARVTGLSPPEGEQEVVELNGIRVHALNLHHGRTRPVENVGFIIEIGASRFLHVGDTEISPADFAKLGLQDESIDFFFVPYWFLAGDYAEPGIVAAVEPHVVIPMHIPPQDDPRDFMKDSGGFEGTIAEILSAYPDAAVFKDVMSTKRFP